MPVWLLSLAVPVVGIPGALLVAFYNHKLQERRERDARAAQARADWVARRRTMCATLLEAAIEQRKYIGTIEKLHANRASRIRLSQARRDAMEHARKIGEAMQQAVVDLALEPNAPLRLAIDKLGDVEQAYFDALMKPILSWNPLEAYLGHVTPDELDRLREAGDAAWLELQSTVREYLAGLEQPAPPARRWRFPRPWEWW